MKHRSCSFRLIVSSCNITSEQVPNSASVLFVAQPVGRESCASIGLLTEYSEYTSGMADAC